MEPDLKLDTRLALVGIAQKVRQWSRNIDLFKRSSSLNGGPGRDDSQEVHMTDNMTTEEGIFCQYLSLNGSETLK